MSDQPVVLYDTTLRDGTQGEGVSYTVDDKVAVARRLDEFGVAVIEGGWPGSNPRDASFFEVAANETAEVIRPRLSVPSLINLRDLLRGEPKDYLYITWRPDARRVRHAPKGNTLRRSGLVHLFECISPPAYSVSHHPFVYAAPYTKRTVWSASKSLA